MKRIIKAFLVFTICVISLVGCDNANEIRYISETESIEYKGNEYVPFDNTNGFIVCEVHNLRKIGSCWHVPFLSKTHFYSDDLESPSYICNSRTPTIWFKKDFIVTDKEFVIENTDVSCNFSDSYIMEHSKTLEEKYKIKSFKWFLQGHENIYVNASLYNKDDVYYIKFVWDEPCYKISEQFYDLLFENELI